MRHIHPILQAPVRDFVKLNFPFIEDDHSNNYHFQNWEDACTREFYSTNALKTFYFFIGGYFGSMQEVEWKENILSIKSASTPEFMVAPRKLFQLQEDDNRWLELTCYLFGRKWKKEYIDPYVCDGYSWVLNVHTADLQIVAEGQNKLPKGFTTFLRLLNNITAPLGVEIS